MVSIVRLALLLLLASAASAQAALRCPAPKPATVTLATDLPPPLIDNTPTLGALQALASKYRPGEHPIGLYVAALQMNYQTGYLFEPVGNEVCVALSGVTISLRFADRKIYVVRDRRPGTCAFDAVLEHERKHQAVDEGIVADFAPRLRQRVEAAIAQAVMPASVPVQNKDAAMKRLDALVNAVIGQGFQEMQAERNRREAAVDSPAEYARVARLCR